MKKKAEHLAAQGMEREANKTEEKNIIIVLFFKKFF